MFPFSVSSTSLGSARLVSACLLFVIASIVLLFGTPHDVAAQTPSATIENTDNQTRLQLNYDGGFYVPGIFSQTTAADSIPASGSGTRLMWYPAKAAFRAGRITTAGQGDAWDPSNVGVYSVAMGVDTRASGPGTVALGRGATAASEASVALGDGATANALYSTAIGEGATARRLYATALGAGTLVDGAGGTALGVNTYAAGRRSTAMGSITRAVGDYSVAMGDGTEAEGESATAFGAETQAKAIASTAAGRGTVAATFNSATFGSWNVENRTFDSSLFVVGNGTDPTDGGSRSDALVLKQSGDLEIAGTFTESSDRRLKTDIEPVDPVLDRLAEIQPVHFRFKEGQGHPTSPQVGLIAQEVRAQFPALVKEGIEGYLSLSYSKFSAVLLKGLQEQQSQIRTQQVQIDTLRDRVRRLENLKTRVAQLESADGDSMLAGISGGDWLFGLVIGSIATLAILRRRRT